MFSILYWTSIGSCYKKREIKGRKSIRVTGFWGELFEKESSIITLLSKSADISNKIQTARWQAAYKTVTCGTALAEMPYVIIASVALWLWLGGHGPQGREISKFKLLSRYYYLPHPFFWVRALRERNGIHFPWHSACAGWNVCIKQSYTNC